MKNAVFRAVQPVLGKRVHVFDNMHLDTLSDISAYRTVVKPQLTAI